MVRYKGTLQDGTEVVVVEALNQKDFSYYTVITANTVDGRKLTKDIKHSTLNSQSQADKIVDRLLGWVLDQVGSNG